MALSRREFLGISGVTLSTTLVQAQAEQGWVEDTLTVMSLEEKVGQLLFPVTSGVFKNVGSEEFEKIRLDLTDYHVGGYHIGRGDPAAVALLTNDLQRIAKVPLIMTADLEAGASIRENDRTLKYVPLDIIQ